MVGEQLDASTYGKSYKDQVINGGTFDGYATTGFPTYFTMDTLYDYDGIWPKSSITDRINNSVHLINQVGHSLENLNMKMSGNDVDSLNNSKHFFIYSQCCHPGAFDQGTSGDAEAIGERFIFTEHGAFGAIMNSRYGWYDLGGTDGA